MLGTQDPGGQAQRSRGPGSGKQSRPQSCRVPEAGSPSLTLRPPLLRASKQDKHAPLPQTPRVPGASPESLLA